MERFIIASLLLLLLASLTVVEGRMGRAAVFDNSMPTNHVLIGGDELPRICDQVGTRRHLLLCVVCMQILLG
jgi:hypothetical protein